MWDDSCLSSSWDMKNALNVTAINSPINSTNGNLSYPEQFQPIGSKIDPRLSATIISPNFTLANTDSTFSELKWLPSLYEDYASKNQPLYEGPVKQTRYDLHVHNTGGVAVTTIDKNCDIFSSVLKPTSCNQMAESEVPSDLTDLIDLLESAAAQNVPGGEVMPNMTVSRQPLASSSSSYMSDSDQSDVLNEGDWRLEATLNTFSDIELLLAQSQQQSNSPALLETSNTVTDVGCHGINQILSQDEMWTMPHSSSSSPSPATVCMEPQLDLNDRALAEMGKRSSSDRDASGPAGKRARLSSDDSTSSVNGSVLKKREKNNEACRKARLNKRQKEAELSNKATHLEEDNARLRRKIASLERKVKEEKEKFLQVMKP